MQSSGKDPQGAAGKRIVHWVIADSGRNGDSTRNGIDIDSNYRENSRMSLSKPQLLLWSLVLFLFASGPLRLFGQPPNIILILSDDQGWNNTEIAMMPTRDDSKSDYYLTPNLRRLGESGMIFSQAYAPHPFARRRYHSIQFGITPAKLKKTTNQGANYA